MNYSHLNYLDMKEYRVTFNLNESQNKESLNLLKAFLKCIGEVEIRYCSPLIHVDTDDKYKMRAVREFRDVWNRLK